MTTTYTSSIKRKVMTAIMLASIAVLLLTVAAFMFYDLVTFRQMMVRNLTIQARIIAENSNVAMQFKNEKDAANVLASLNAEPHIVAAAIYDDQGKLFVKYPTSISDTNLPDAPQAHGHQFGKSYLTFFQPIVISDTPVGTLFLRSDMKAISERLQLYGAISLIIMLGSLGVAFWLSNTLQKRISNPIIVLAETAKKISEEHNYSVRAPKLSDDELGVLTDSFNNMLERIQASDSALRTSEGQFRLVTDQAKVSLAHLDSQVRYKFANNIYAARYGYKPDEIIGKHAAEIVGQALFEKARPHIEKTLAGAQVQFELEFHDVHSERRWSHAEYTPEKNSAGEVIGFVVAHTDITLRKQTEMEIERARDQALAASRAKDDFLAALSHELRTPLNPVLLVASDAASNPLLPAETRAVFDMIRSNVELEARLIDDLLDLTRITRGKLPLEMRPLDLLAVLRDAIGTIQPDAEKKHIMLNYDFGVEPHLITGDAVRLRQIFWNILKNAVKFTPDGGRITIAICPLDSQGKIAVKITDTGIGMSSEEIGHIFNAFSQGDHAGKSGSHRFGGLGLGLAISQMLVELHSGIIRAESSGRDQGAIFTIELPCLQAGEKSNSADAEPKNDSEKTVKKTNGLRILLVEDHEPTRTALAHLLTRRNYKVMIAASVAEASALARQESFDLVVSDIGLPDGNGYDLMSELKDTFGLKGIALTGYGMERDIIAAQNAGFVAHLTKPIRVESLEKALSDAV